MGRCKGFRNVERGGYKGTVHVGRRVVYVTGRHPTRQAARAAASSAAGAYRNGDGRSATGKRVTVHTRRA